MMPHPDRQTEPFDMSLAGAATMFGHAADWLIGKVNAEYMLGQLGKDSDA